MKIISWNLAGIKARANDIQRLMQEHRPDIVCLQKTRTDKAPDFDCYRAYVDCSDQWSGVATYVRIGLEGLFVESDSHHLILEFDEFVLINAYVPYSNSKVPGYIERRKEWDKWIVEFVKAQTKPVIICGDLNIVHQDMDSFYPSCVRNTGCYYQWERDDFNRLLSEGNMIDSFRYLHPEERAYTYFDTMHGVDYRVSNQGTRLDYFLVNEPLMSKVSASEILSPMSAPSNPIMLVVNVDDSNHDVLSKIKAFIVKYLDGNIDNLPGFPLAKLKGDREFGCPGRTFDPDDTEIMRLIYVSIFSDVWPELTMESLKVWDFRGDTLNTYNTMFGQPDEHSLHPGLDKYSPSEELIAKVENFYTNIFPTVGNMVVLPNKRTKDGTLNTYRGRHSKWHDFFDRFLVEFMEGLINSTKDEKLAILIEANKEYLSRFYDESGVNKLMERLFLTEYLDGEGKPIANSKGYFFWMGGVRNEDYLSEASRYIDFASNVIKKRGELITNALKEKLMI